MVNEGQFRNIISKGGRFPPEKGRYHLYVGLFCPFAHRALIARELKGLQEYLPISVVKTFKGEKGWAFKGGYPDRVDLPGVTEDHLYGSQFLQDIYFKADPKYEGVYSVPVLWDKKEQTIVNNESAEILHMLNTVFEDQVKSDIDLYPLNLREEIDGLNSWITDTVNHGVYKVGFSRDQQGYDQHIGPLFDSLDRIEGILGKDKKYLTGDSLTEADVRLYPTLIRFDPVYVVHFKCNIGTIRHNYPNINRYMRNLYWNHPAFKNTTDFDHIKRNYYESHTQVNPTRIIPRGPVPNIEPL